MSLATIAFFQRLLQPKRNWQFKLAAAAVIENLLVVLITTSSGYILGVWFDILVATLSNLILDAWIMAVVWISAREGWPDARLLFAPQASNMLVDILGGVAWTTFQLDWRQRIDGISTLV